MPAKPDFGPVHPYNTDIDTTFSKPLENLFFSLKYENKAYFELKADNCGFQC